MSKEKQIHIRITEEEKEKIEKNANRLGFRQVSEYLRFIGLLKPTYTLDISGKASIVIESNKDNEATDN